MRASLYARVSTEDQLLGYSLDAQSRAFNSLVKDRIGPSTASMSKRAAHSIPTTSESARYSSRPSRTP